MNTQVRTNDLLALAQSKAWITGFYKGEGAAAAWVSEGDIYAPLMVWADDYNEAQEVESPDVMAVWRIIRSLAL